MSSSSCGGLFALTPETYTKAEGEHTALHVCVCGTDINTGVARLIHSKTTIVSDTSRMDGWLVGYFTDLCGMQWLLGAEIISFGEIQGLGKKWY
jgi:hypothetical protein